LQKSVISVPRESRSTSVSNRSLIFPLAGIVFFNVLPSQQWQAEWCSFWYYPMSPSFWYSPVRHQTVVTSCQSIVIIVLWGMSGTWS
jgi:hypothetical protein